MNHESLTPDSGTPVTDAAWDFAVDAGGVDTTHLIRTMEGLEINLNRLVTAIEKHKKTMTMRPDFVDEELWAVLASVKGGAL